MSHRYEDEEFEGRWFGTLADLTPPAWLVAFAVCVLVVDACRTRVDLVVLRDRIEVLEGGEP